MNGYTPNSTYSSGGQAGAQGSPCSGAQYAQQNMTAGSQFPTAAGAGTAPYGMPAGIPAGQGNVTPIAGVMPGDLTPLSPLNQPMPVTVSNMQYINGFLRTVIGRKVTVDFLIGTNTLVDKTGTLLGVGANYILINEIETDDILVCDFYTIKFVKIYG